MRIHNVLRRFLMSGAIAGSLTGSGLGNVPVPLEWELGYPEKDHPQVIRWTRAVVPGAVQLDVARAEGYGPYYYAENWRDYLWMEDREFIYRTRFERPALEEGERLCFISRGIDYAFVIYINGEELLEQEGMFTPVELDVTDFLQPRNELLITIHPVPKLHNRRMDRSQAAAAFKPAVSYGWDWHPRLIPSGIWDETFLEIRNVSHISDVYIDYRLSENLSEAAMRFEISGTGLDECRVEYRLLDPGGNQVLEGSFSGNGATAGGNGAVAGGSGVTREGTSLVWPETRSILLEEPQLWWPHDHGKPALYKYILDLYDPAGEHIQQVAGQTGFRRVRLVMNQGTWMEPQGFPKSRSPVPVQMEINGRKIFCKGTNWVNPEIFPGIITRDRYNELLERALEANFNMLRVWGGGIVNKESFHELCDEKGILVWQEFPLACNNYPDDPAYLEVLVRESASIIRRVRRHPSLAIWSGGNELFNSWSGMTDQSLALRTLNSQCLQLDPGTPYINTSPLMGMGHGHYVFRDMETGEEVYSIMARAHFTAYTEFGMPAPSPVEILEMIIPPGQLWPPQPGTSWESHHAFRAWVGNTWLMQDMIEDYFGRTENLESLVEKGQLLQCEGYKAIYEEARRQKPYCSMALNWCFNEPWPTAANNSIINWPDSPKPGFFAVSEACRPVLASAANKKFTWQTGETFLARLWLLNDRPEPVPGGRMTVRLVSGERELELASWEFGPTETGTNIEGPEVSAVLPEWESGPFTLKLDVEGHPEYSSDYTFLIQTE